MKGSLFFHYASALRLTADVMPSVSHLAAGRWRLKALISALKPPNKACHLTQQHMGPGSHTQLHVNISLSSAGWGALSSRKEGTQPQQPPPHRQCQLGPRLRLLAGGDAGPVKLQVITAN